MTPLPDSSRGETDILAPCAWFQNRTWRFIRLSFRARADLKGFKEDYERRVPAGNLREIPDKKVDTLSTDSPLASVLFSGSGQEVYKGVGGVFPGMFPDRAFRNFNRGRSFSCAEKGERC
jgi:hypothetical protein